MTTATTITTHASALTSSSTHSTHTHTDEEIEIQNSFSTLSLQPELQAMAAFAGTATPTPTVDAAEWELMEARNRRAQVRIRKLERSVEMAEQDRREHERTYKQKMALQADLDRAQHELHSNEGIVRSKELEVLDLTKKLSYQTTRGKQLEFLLKAAAIDEEEKKKHQELAVQYAAEKQARESAEQRCLELEEALKTSHQKAKELAQQHSVDRTAKEEAQARCQELQGRLKDSHQKNQELAALLRQKTSQIQSMLEEQRKYERDEYADYY